MPGASYDPLKHHITAAYGVVIADSGHVLLCRHAQLRRSAWTAPGGFVLDDRDPREAVLGALRAEAGLDDAELDDDPFLIWDGGISGIPSDDGDAGAQRVRAAYLGRTQTMGVGGDGSTAYEWFAVADLPEPRTRLVDVAMSALSAPEPTEDRSRRSRRG